MINRALFTSNNQHWRTPGIVYAALNDEFHFSLDPCPNKGTDGLVRSWENERVYCNPPYGRGVDEWLKKASESVLSVYLLPSRTDTRWWHDYAMKATEIRFLKGRLKFGDSKNCAPFPSVVLIFDNRKDHDPS